MFKKIVGGTKGGILLMIVVNVIVFQLLKL